MDTIFQNMCIWNCDTTKFTHLGIPSF